MKVQYTLMIPTIVSLYCKDCEVQMKKTDDFVEDNYPKVYTYKCPRCKKTKTSTYLTDDIVLLPARTTITSHECKVDNDAVEATLLRYASVLEEVMNNND